MEREKNLILERWARVVSECGSRAALFAPDGSSLKTFSQIDEDAKRWSGRLGAAGVLALQVGNDPEWPAILLAAWQTGIPVIPFDRDLTGERRGRVESLCGVSLRIEREGGELVMTALDNSPADWPVSVPHLLKVTSGTSGDARVIRFTASQLLADCDSVCETMGIGEDDVNYGAISFAHSYGFSNLITPLLCRGIPLVVAGDMMPRALQEGLAKSRATVFPSVPAIYRTLAGFEPSSRTLRLCISAGAPLQAEVAREFSSAWQLKVHSFYGASECGGICYDASEDMSVPQGFVGPAMRGVEVAPLVSPGESPVEVKSRAVGGGYFPQSSREAIDSGVFRPSDLLEWNGTGYVIVGRISDVINVAGRKVSPHEVEAVIRQCPGVREAIVLGLSTPARGQEVAACIVGDVSEECLRAHCAKSLAPWQVPRQWRVIESMPVNARGKTTRNELRKLFG